MEVTVPTGGADAIEFFNNMLDIRDIADPIMVSYIAEYIDFSDSRVSESCKSFYDIALRLAQKEVSSSEDGEISIRNTYDELEQEAPEREYYNDTLAYYPPKDPSSLSNKEAAFRYYIAKELKSFLVTLQEFLELKDFLEDYNNITAKQSFIESFLDKLETVGYNVSTTTRVDSDTGDVETIYGSEDSSDAWDDAAEGLYMELYAFRPGGEGDTLPYSDLPEIGVGTNFGLSTDTVGKMRSGRDIKIGLRMCIRDSSFHDGATEGDSLPFLSLSEPRPDTLFDRYIKYIPQNKRDMHQAWTQKKGIPIITIERTLEEIRSQAGITHMLSPFDHDFDRRKIFDYLKKEMAISEDFRLMFEYIFPVKKLFNYLMILMDQGTTAMMSVPENIAPEPRDNDSSRANFVYEAAGIDPEQFIEAKGIAKSILENIWNSNNYSYGGNSELQAAGGPGNLAMNNLLDGF